MGFAPVSVLGCRDITVSPGGRGGSGGSAAPFCLLKETPTHGSFPGRVPHNDRDDVPSILTGHPAPGHPWGGSSPLPVLLQVEACASPLGSDPARQGMEPGRPVPAELKLRKPSQRARIQAPFFAHLVGRWLRPRPPARPLDRRPPETPVTLPAQGRAAESADPPGLDPVEADALVPTHDERGRAIPEWKRQVMARRLRARLADEEAADGQVRGAPGMGRAR